MKTEKKSGNGKERGRHEKEKETAVRADYDNYVMGGRERRRVLLAGILGSVVCGYLYFHSYAAGAVTALCSIFLLPVYKRMKADAGKNDLRLQFRDFLYSVSASVNTGRSLEEAMEDAYGMLIMIYGEKSCMAEELKRMIHVIRDTNCSAEPLLRDLAERSHIHEISEFVDVCVTCRRTGGDLASLIAKASDIITQNIELTREKHVLLSQKRLESRILALMPPAVIFLINMSSSDYLSLMYTTAEGRLIMGISLLGTAGSFLWSFRLISFD